MEPLKERELLPSFRLESIGGESIGPSDFKGKKNLVILIFDLECGQCTDFLCEAAGRYDDYKDLNADILAVGEASVMELKQFTDDMHLPFPVLADPDGTIGSRYSNRRPMIVVTDRFGEIRLVGIAEDGEELPDQDKVLTRLHLIELECPECGVPTWPP